MTDSGHVRHRLSAIGIVTVLLTLTGLTAVAMPAVADAAAGSHRARATGDPDFERPVVGECHDYGYGDYLKPHNGAPVVDCLGAHSAVTVAVVTVPKRVHISPKGISPTVFDQIGRACFAGEDAALTLSEKARAKTAYDLSYYTPSRHQLAKGARWVRCDLVLLAGRALSELPAPLPGTGDIVRRCLTVSPHAVITTSCRSHHNYRSTRVFTLHGKRFPGVPALQRQALAHCQLGPGVSWFASWTPDYEWNHSRHHQLVCYRRTAS